MPGYGSPSLFSCLLKVTGVYTKYGVLYSGRITEVNLVMRRLIPSRPFLTVGKVYSSSPARVSVSLALAGVGVGRRYLGMEGS